MAASLASSRSVAGARVCSRASRGARVSRQNVRVCAKYGDGSKYFDLNDLTNTTGSWDMYGDDSPKRYPGLQDEFFQRAGESLSRRDALRTFVGVAGVLAIGTFGLKGSVDAKLPITAGPNLAKSENGKGGKFGRL